jgi:pimeloyl-ACP methyl ester carboxylesterase
MGEVVLVHGAWHGAWCWEGVIAELRRLDLAVTAVELPLAGLAEDAATARVVIDATGPGSVVVGHSYGGAVISEAAVGVQSVTRLIYLAAFLTEPDEDMGALMTGSLLTQSLIVDGSGVRVDPAVAAQLFYGDSNPDIGAAMVAKLRPMAIAAPASSTNQPAWRTIPSTYVVCTNDQALPVGSQRRMAARADLVVEWPTDHSPFVTRPAAIAELIAQYVT